MDNLLKLTSKDVNYDLAHLLYFLRQHLKPINDNTHADKLDISAPAMSKLSNRVLPVGATVLRRMREISGINIKQLHALMGDHRARFMMSDDQFCRE